MKKIFFGLSCLLLFLSTFAQTNDSEDCKSLLTIKREFLLKNFILPDSVTVPFWTVYNTYLQQEEEITTQYRDELLRLNIKRTNGIIVVDSLSEDQIKGLLIAKFILKEERLAIDKKLFQELSGILTMKQYYELTEVLKLFKSNIKEACKSACKHE